MPPGAKCADAATLSSDAEGADAALDALAAFLEIDHDAPSA